jgi:hypothetical protein
MDDETLRDLVRARTGHVPLTRDACPTPEALQSVATEPRGDTAQLAVLEHVATCAPCRADFDLLRTAHAAANDVTASVVSRPRWIPVLAAAAVIGVISLTVSRTRSDDVVRGAGGDSVGVQLITASRSDSVTLLQWHAVPQAVSYRVEVTDASGSLAFSAETADTVSRVPAARGSALRWSVEAKMLDGTTLTSRVDTLEPRR